MAGSAAGILGGMTTVERLFNEALSLSEEERSELITRLTREGPPITGPRDAAELVRIAESVRAGQEDLMTAEEVLAGLADVRERYRARKGS
jgi:hypothetical protein